MAARPHGNRVGGLRALAIRDFVIVDRLELEFGAGFSALTGETGAGKSILIDALGLLLGGRADPGVVRPGRERAELSAEFDIDGEAGIAQWLEAHELSDPDGGACLLRRSIDAGGRSRAFINGHGVTLGQLRELGEQLVDIHGQHSHQSLARPAEQRAILDGFGGHQELVARVATAWQAWQAARRARQDAERGQAELSQRREELEWQTAQLSALAFEADEWEAVNQEHARLGNAAAPCSQRLKHWVIGTNACQIRPLARCRRFLAGLHYIFAQHHYILTTQNGARGFGCHKLSVVLHRHIQGTAPNQLPRHAAPGGIGQILAHAESRQLIMGKLRDLICQSPAQHIHHMHHAKALTGAQHG
jgi:hypothetical protein